jgi:deoxyribonuclease-4
MRIGFHVSIAGGISLSIKRALEVGCTTMQIFTHSPRAWNFPPITSDEAEAFKRARAKSGISPVFVHTSYLINLATPTDELFHKSVDALRTELLRADEIGAEYVVTHLGSASGCAKEESVLRVASGLRLVLDGLRTKSRLLLENTACERGDVGCSFEDIAEIIRLSRLDGLGVTVDTCHSYGAGYDLKHKEGLEETISIIQKSLGFDKVKLIHLNDSKHPLGSHRDRHEEIGLGELGTAAFRRILRHPKLRDIPFVMETPKSGPEDDIRNMAVALRLAGKAAVKTLEK